MKKFAMVLFAAILLCTMTGCSNTQPAAPAASTLATPLNTLVAELVPGAADMASLPLTDLEDIIGISPDDFSDAVYLQSTALEGGEALVLRAVDDNAAKSIVELLNNYLQRRCEETQNYVPEAYKLLKDTSVQRKNNTIALIVTENAADVTTKLLAGE